MRLVGLWCVLLLAMVASAAAGPLDKPAFTATAAELLAEAKGATAGDHDAIVLREDSTLTFDARGRVEARHRLVFAILAPSAIDNWGTLGLDWSPFYQDRPQVRGRVVSPDGSVAEFDQSLIHDAPTVSESPTVFSDRRDLSAPLPRLVVGAVVEEEFVFTDREPLLAAGTLHWLPVRRGVPIRRKVLTVSAPTALKARVATRGPALAVKPRTRVAGDRTIVTYDLANLATSVDSAPGVPSNYLANPFAVVATGASWAAIAADYRAQVEQRLAAGVPLPADLKAATPRATVDRIVAWVHAQVRYTGIELSDSAIIPVTPAETLARGFGDCKDKATLLVALLRAAGVTADVALLSTGPGWDIDPALPGMGGFDHAIVRAVVDGKDLWIDATEDLLPAGQLPVRDQGRRALIIAKATRALTLTPVAAPADNLIREVRTFHLAEQRSGTVTELSEQRGIWSDDLRAWIRNSAKGDVHDSLAHYVEKEYRAKLVTYVHSDPHDLATPFTLTLDADQVGRVADNSDGLTAWLFPTDTLERLPPEIVDADDAPARAAKDRTVDYVWARPHVYEIVNRIELPPGYSAPDLPAHEARALGAMTLTIRRARDAGAMTITYRLDSGPRRITAAQLRATRAAVAQLEGEGSHKVVIALDAATLASQGKVAEAVAEHRRLIALHPKEGLHHAQLAFTLVTTGMGDAARREARLATTIDPTDARGWVALGFALQCDRLGRVDRPGNDRAGAIAAYRKALALEPTHVGAKRTLAKVLASDAGGHISTDVADLRAAAGLRLELRAADVDVDVDDLIATLAQAGDLARLDELARSLPSSDQRRGAEILLATLRQGVAAGVRIADGAAAGRDRAELLRRASSRLVLLRRYADGRALREAANGALPAAERAYFDRLRAVDLDRLPPGDPTTPVKLAIERMVAGPRPRPPWSPEVDDELASGAAGVGSVISSAVTGTTRAVLIDVTLAAGEFTTDGSDRLGWRVRIDMAGQPLTFYVARDRHRAILIGGETLPRSTGRALIDAVKRKDLSGARRWAVRMADDLVPTSARGAPLGEFLRRHKTGFGDAPAPVLELLGALALGDRAPASTAAVVRTCAGLTGDDDLDACRLLTISMAARAGDLPTAIAAQRARVDAKPTDAALVAQLVELLADARRGAAAVAAVAPLLAVKPDDPNLLAARAYAGLAVNWGDARPWFERLTAPVDAGGSDLNNAAWVHTFFDPTPQAARALMERLFARGGDKPRHWVNTYAVVLADAGEPSAAWRQLDGVLDDDITPSDWYVVGRIAEAYGLRDDAIGVYRSIARPTQRSAFPSAWDFAQKRLKALGVTTATP
ncbi:MAG: DUF3857 domain-containing protein [Myxococcales bacterium]|nr:DUF3857 domain-containing protein [Myxococcales bacterium]